MAERQLPKLNVAGSIPVSRSIFRLPVVVPTRLESNVERVSPIAHLASQEPC